MTITGVQVDDLDQLSLLFDGYRVFYKMQSNIEGAREFLSERLHNNEAVIFVAREDEGKLVGFVQLYPLFTSTRLKRIWLLNDLFVDPAFRGRRVSVMLIDRAKRHARETNSAGLVLETAKSNTIGNSLYPRTDFVLDQEHNYYSWNV
jgi:ribosomal protein S18 acetylase RimI-like enzyme